MTKNQLQMVVGWAETGIHEFTSLNDLSEEEQEAFNTVKAYANRPYSMFDPRLNIPLDAIRALAAAASDELDKLEDNGFGTELWNHHEQVVSWISRILTSDILGP